MEGQTLNLSWLAAQFVPQTDIQGGVYPFPSTFCRCVICASISRILYAPCTSTHCNFISKAIAELGALYLMNLTIGFKLCRPLN